MTNVELGEMAFNHDDLNRVLNLVDRMIGKQYKDHQILLNQGMGLLKVISRCRACKRVVGSEHNYNEPGWSERLMTELIVLADTHQSQNHKSLILTGNAIGNAIHCDVCGLEAGTDAKECSDEFGKSLWVCTKCAESAEKYANSFRVAT